MEKPVGWYKGKPGGTVREYSDILLIFLLKALRPEKYRERVEVRGSLAHIDFNRLSDDQLTRIAAGEHILAVLATPAEPVAALPPAASENDVRAADGDGAGPG